MNFLKNLVIKGNIPGYQYFLKYGGYLGLLSLGIFVDAGPYKEYGERAWFLLMLIMVIGPLSDIFPKIGIFSKIKGLRKPLGIIAGCFIIAHSLGYFLHYKGVISPISMVKDSSFWSIQSGLLWGTLGTIIAIVLLITSNEFSVKHFGSYWKSIQRFSHFLFTFTVLHILFITNFRKVGVLIIFLLYLILHILKLLNIKF